MNPQINIRLSFAFVITMTSFQSAWSGSHFLRAAINRNEASTLIGRDSQTLHRRTRSAQFPFRPVCTSLHQLIDIKNRFERWMDKDQNGRANFTEVRSFLRTLKPAVTDEIVTAFIQRRDQNENGQIDLIPEYVEESVGDDYGEAAAREWFYLHDINDDRFVTKEELIELSQILGMSPEQAEAATTYYLPLDINKDGKLNFLEFSQIYQPPQPPQQPPSF